MSLLWYALSLWENISLLWSTHSNESFHLFWKDQYEYQQFLNLLDQFEKDFNTKVILLQMTAMQYVKP